jgi:hypothetical protein
LANHTITATDFGKYGTGSNYYEEERGKLKNIMKGYPFIY